MRRRYLVSVPELANVPLETLVRRVAPAIDRYLASARSGTPAGVRQHHRRLDLPLRDAPVRAQQALDLWPRQQPIAVLLVETDRPFGGAPSADQDWLRADRFEMLEEHFPDSLAPLIGPHVR